MKQHHFLRYVAVAVLAAGFGITACGSSSKSTTTTTTSHSESPTTAASHTESSIAGVAFYKPSTVESHTGHSAQLTSPDSVSKVNSFYANEIEKGGWTTVSKSTTAYSGNFVIKKSGQGATISVSPSGSGSRISISAYPV